MNPTKDPKSVTFYLSHCLIPPMSVFYFYQVNFLRWMKGPVHSHKDHWFGFRYQIFYSLNPLSYSLYQFPTKHSLQYHSDSQTVLNSPYFEPPLSLPDFRKGPA